MATHDPRVDAYIAKSAAFAKPILEHLRAVVHAGCPGAEETIKWGLPHFDYEGPLCHMAAFKAHCAFGFWKGALVLGDDSKAGSAMGQMGRLTAISDLPPKKELIGLVKKAARLNEEGIAAPRARKTPKPPPKTPPDLAAALKKNAKARTTFDGFPPSHKREYIEWITEAKTEPTRQKRLAQTLVWLAEGKSRNWKYERKA